MKKKESNNKELWLKNNTGSDVSLSDLGVKVLANRTVNVYAYNPYITEEQVKVSMEGGALFKRLVSKVLEVVEGFKQVKPHTLEHLKISKNPTQVVKSKSAVFIDTREEDVLDDEDLGNIADYGLGELGHTNTENVVTEDGSIVVKQNQDSVEDEITEVKTMVELGKITNKLNNSNISDQSVVVMADQVNSQSNPVGKIADDESPNESFVVVKAPKAKSKSKAKPKAKLKAKKVGSMVVVDEQKKVKSVEATVPDDSEQYDAQIATKDSDGAIVMKFKEVAKVAKKTKKAEKPKVVKVTKKKAKKKASKKGKTSKKNS